MSRTKIDYKCTLSRNVQGGDDRIETCLMMRCGLASGC